MLSTGVSLVWDLRSSEPLFYLLVGLTLPWSIIFTFIWFWFVHLHSDYFIFGWILLFLLAGIVNGAIILLLSNLGGKGQDEAKARWRTRNI